MPKPSEMDQLYTLHGLDHGASSSTGFTQRERHPWTKASVSIPTPQPRSHHSTSTGVRNPYAGRLSDTLSTTKQQAGQKRQFSSQQHPQTVTIVNRAHAGSSRSDRPTKRPRLDRHLTRPTRRAPHPPNSSTPPHS
ncbi:uncharacterized protein SCHCODRAFT_02200994 [Schizophyllum commune H4-8]|uniref:uncharacterized protein n=1 Tax=Schizophyllum commune (strain H4-8 / FGSC 9210) TaxID=578458 RepID=UPI0021605FA0|nr:uncharacterized protein SCHCODRAFT_02200994 [Schizophyllum commune H4-8]KAI5896878.1 hypothetical protein SCHCODRAFT_02200994 [Schizophyllum commune H4-8]